MPSEIYLKVVSLDLRTALRKNLNYHNFSVTNCVFSSNFLISLSISFYVFTVSVSYVAFGSSDATICNFCYSPVVFNKVSKSFHSNFYAHKFYKVLK